MINKFKHVIIIIIISWTCIWLRNFYKDFSSHFEETKKLCGKSLQKKWEYVFGADLYRYLSMSEKIIPQYKKIFFVHNLNLYKSQRADYFLYPRIQSKDSDYIMVYRHPFAKDDRRDSGDLQD